MIHLFENKQLEGVDLPDRFTYPFCYVPHPLCKLAAHEVQKYLQNRTEWDKELRRGKMFGVLIVQTPQGGIGFLAAFSGLLDGSSCHEYFVPPVYDLLSPDGFFKAEEAKISAMNRNIEVLCQQIQPVEKEMEETLKQMHKDAEKELRVFKERMDKAKELRKIRREEMKLTDEENAALVKESQFMKAEYKRLERKWSECLKKKQEELQAVRMPILAMEEKRKTASAALQIRLFEQFRMLNAKGEERNLCDIFKHTPQRVPPAGAGECAAPKLLQYAYRNQLKPMAMAEFWWGESPKSEVRIHGYYYPSCKQKCLPILSHMLQGLEVEPNPLEQEKVPVGKIQVVYEDDCLLVVNKPSGVLSVPGKECIPSVLDYIKEKYPEADGPLLVHRLDMDTSGALLVAKNKEVHETLQMQFEGREVKKRYIALLDGELPADCPPKGFIKLPLRPDYDNRPFQLVDFERGKPAVTRYEVLGIEQKEMEGVRQVVTRIAYYPQTGRTHQLRVHSAHSLGMNRPILGDPLYGCRGDRLYLHAEKLEFRHPITGKIMKFQLPSPF